MILMLPVSAWGADYFACAAGEVHENNKWCTSAHVTGSCANDGTTEANTAAILVAGNNFYANGCTMTIADSFTVSLISTLDGDGAGNAVAGGGFTIGLTDTITNKTLTTTITAGTTDCLTITDIADANNGVLIIVGDITGASTGTQVGINDGRADADSLLTINGNITGGSNANSYGYYPYNTGTTNITGNLTGGSHAAAEAVYVGSSGAVTVTGNLIASTSAAPYRGKVRWTPTAPSSGVTGHYIKFDGGGTAVYAGKNTDDAAKALTTFYYIDPTDGTSDQGSATTGGGGAWGF